MAEDRTLTHVDEHGAAHMVDVGRQGRHAPARRRRARSSTMQPETLAHDRRGTRAEGRRASPPRASPASWPPSARASSSRCATRCRSRTRRASSSSRRATTAVRRRITRDRRDRRQDRRRDGGAHGGLGRRAHPLRHVQGRRPRHGRSTDVRAAAQGGRRRPAPGPARRTHPMDAEQRSAGPARCVVGATSRERRPCARSPASAGTLVLDRGFEGDAHAGDWHRQVSPARASSRSTRCATKGLDVGPGDFAENITTEGIDLMSLPVGTVVRVGDDVVLEISQIGKVCHTKCAIYYQAGDCVMPREGIFAVVREAGRRARRRRGRGRRARRRHVRPRRPRRSPPSRSRRAANECRSSRRAERDGELRIGVVTCSDTCAEARPRTRPGTALVGADRGARLGRSSPTSVVPDDRVAHRGRARRSSPTRRRRRRAHHRRHRASARATSRPRPRCAVCDREVPGIAEHIRAESLAITRRAMLSRAVAAQRGTTLVVNLPGSEKAVRETLRLRRRPARARGRDDGRRRALGRMPTSAMPPDSSGPPVGADAPERRVYLDHAATSWPKPPEVAEAVTAALTERGGNPGRGAHRMALDSRTSRHRARAATCARSSACATRDDLIFQPGCTRR